MLQAAHSAEPSGEADAVLEAPREALSFRSQPLKSKAVSTERKTHSADLKLDTLFTPQEDAAARDWHDYPQAPDKRRHT